MERRFGNPVFIDQCSSYEDACDLDALLHPAQAFEHPSDVVNDPDLTLNEKRAILASWASDACAMEAACDGCAPCARPRGKKARQSSCSTQASVTRKELSR
jgi:hypothetical protein